MIEAQEYLDIVERVSCIFHHMYAYSWIPYVVHRATILPMYKEILHKDTLLKQHTDDPKAL